MNLLVSNSRIRLSHGQLFWQEVGHGKTIVFLHGSWWTGEQWGNVVPLLSPHHHCLMPDLLGFGESGQPQGHSSIAMQVETLAEFLAFLRISDCILVGHSTGAWVAAAYALEHPEHVKGLGVLSPEGVDAPGLKKRWQGYGLLSSPVPLVGWVLRSLHSLARLFGKGHALQTALRHRRYLRSAPEACRLLFRRRRSEIKAELLGDRLSMLACPLELVQGEQDDDVAIALIHAYAEAAHASISSISGDTGKREPWLYASDSHGGSSQGQPRPTKLNSISTIQKKRGQKTRGKSKQQSGIRRGTRDRSPLKALLKKAGFTVAQRPSKPLPANPANDRSQPQTEAVASSKLNGAIAHIIKDFVEQHL